MRLELPTVSAKLKGKLIDLIGELLVCCEDFAQTYECSNDQDAHLHCPPGFEYVCQHQAAVLAEHEREGAGVSMFGGTGRKLGKG